MKKKYWTNFWIDYTKKSVNKDAQSQVLRTYSKIQIDQKIWQFTLSEIEKHFKPQKSDTILDLCGGNGLLAKEFSEQCSNLLVVDISEDLINKIDTQTYKNITTLVADIREVHFENNLFSKIIFYAGIQYFTYKETIYLFESMYKWLKRDGVIFIGDIPDADKVFKFYNNKEREKVYFETIKNEKPIIGTWFKKDFLIKLSHLCNYKEANIISQHPKLINSFYRYDMVIKK